MHEIKDVLVNDTRFCMLHGNWMQYLKEFHGNLDIRLVLTDPPYQDHVISVEFLTLCPNANLISFMPGEKHLDDANEYHYWLKPESTKNYSKNCGRFVERIAIFRVNVTFNQLHWSQMTGIHRDRLIEKPIHPFQKPLTLMERFIRIYSDPGDIIFDPHMGLGTVVIAAIRLGRRAIGIESDLNYYELACERMNKELS